MLHIKVPSNLNVFTVHIDSIVQAQLYFEPIENVGQVSAGGQQAHASCLELLRAQIRVPGQRAHAQPPPCPAVHPGCDSSLSCEGKKINKWQPTLLGHYGSQLASCVLVC